MYTAHFKLNAAPFSHTPDPHYLYSSERHRAALEYVLQAITEESGCIVLTGASGSGKTILCRCLIAQLPDTIEIALLSQPPASPQQFFITLFDKLNLLYRSNYTIQDFLQAFTAYLFAAHSVGRHALLILDEAHRLSPLLLQQLETLLILETDEHKLLQIIFVGQPTLKSLLKQHKPIYSQIHAHYRLLSLASREVPAYINHRLAISGARHPLFTDDAMREVYRYAGGLPRLINSVCDNALLIGYSKNLIQIDTDIVKKAAIEVCGQKIRFSLPVLSPVEWAKGGIALLLFASVIAWWWMYLMPLEINELSKNGQIMSLSLPNNNSHIIPTPTVTAVATSGKINITNSLSEILQDKNIKSDMETANHILFQQWHINYPTLVGKTVCDKAASQGLSCLQRKGNWQDIRTVNRPALLEFVAHNNKKHYAVVTRLHNDTATIDFAGQLFEINIDKTFNKKAAAHWNGQFLLLWRPPSVPVPHLRLGMSSRDVLWLRKHLDILAGRISENSPLSPQFDKALQQRIIAFQRSRKLTADGMVGEQTLLLLSAGSDDGPQLSSQ